MISKGLEFTKEQVEKLDQVLTKLHWDTEAESILLADVTGQMISVVGYAEINTAAISAVAAGSLAATKEMARLVGEPARFKLVLQEGDTRSVYLSDVGEELVLITIFGKNTPIGLVRLSTQKAVGNFLEIVNAAQKNPVSSVAFYPEGKTSLVNELTDSLDNLFKSA